MKVVVFSCAAYSDAWGPFFTLFRKYWPDCPYPVWLVTDTMISKPTAGWLDSRNIFTYKNPSWNEIMVQFTAAYPDEPIMMFQEDYFLTSQVSNFQVGRAEWFLNMRRASCVRLYPCPGGDIEIGDPCYALIATEAPYRVSTQVAIWRPGVLNAIASATKTPWEFEINGTKLLRSAEPSPELTHGFYAWKREVHPWPIEYICTAIVRGVWQYNAVEYCRAQGIEIDTSRRPLQDPPTPHEARYR